MEVFKPLKTYKFQPQIVREVIVDEENVKSEGEGNGKSKRKGKEDVLPLDILTYKNFQKERFDTFNQAADEFYSAKVGADIKKVQEDIWAKQVGKYEKRLRIQEESLEKFQKTVIQSKKRGDLLYSHYSEVQNILYIIHQAREKFSWAEIASKLKKGRKEGMKEAQSIESLDKMGVLTLILKQNE